ncbi:DUF2637 domain-containing protein [Streptomyces niveus]|uniref:DUF2637 domain-containing protein n=1 Tax=Streptomyces niveus TaxID=193462 RepID=UPI00386509E1
MKYLKRLDPILIQAVLAAALSFAHIHDVALAAGQTGWKAWAYPVSVDLLMVMAWKRIRTPDAPKLGAWFWFLLSLAASLGANVATAGVLDMNNLPVQLRVLVAGWPAVAFLGGSLLVHTRKPSTGDEERQTPAVEPAEDSVEEVPREPVKAPEKPHLVTYAEAADSVGVADVTVRGWAQRGHIKKYDGPTAGSVRVDLKECTALQARRPVSA